MFNIWSFTFILAIRCEHDFKIWPSTALKLAWTKDLKLKIKYHQAKFKLESTDTSVLNTLMGVQTAGTDQFQNGILHTLLYPTQAVTIKPKHTELIYCFLIDWPWWKSLTVYNLHHHSSNYSMSAIHIPLWSWFIRWSKIHSMIHFNNNIMWTWVSRLMIAYIALFSALLSRLIALACGSAWVTSFVARFCFWISTEVVYLQCWHGWCHMKLQPSRRKSCVHHTTMFHVTLCKATYVRCMRV